MPPLKVLSPDVHHRHLDIERSVSGDRLDYLVYDETDPAAIPDEIWSSCDAVLIWHRMRMPADVVAKLRRCRMIVRVGVGFDNVDAAACRAAGIPLCNVPNYGSTEVADHALAMLLYLVRGLGTYQDRMRTDMSGFVAEGAPVVRRIRGAVFGAIGMGRIGTAIARRAAGFDMKVIYVDPFQPEGHELGLGLERVRTQEELLRRADIVSLHVPLSEPTRNLINPATLAQMKAGSILVNIARGGLVDIDAVYAALKSGHLAAAALDVFPKEPPSPAPALLRAWQDKEAWLDGRLVVSPHAAFWSAAGDTDMRTFSAEILLDFLFEGRLRNNVNPGWDTRHA